MGIYLTKKNATTNKVEKFKVAGNSGYSYPVGSIYMSTNNTSPASMFGGTWEQVKDRFILGAGDTYSAGATGGEATHTLTVNEMPSHTHNLRTVTDSSPVTRWATSTSGDNYVGVVASNNTYNYGGNLIYNEDTGGSQAHNNMPPYLAVYCWKRIS